MSVITADVRQRATLAAAPLVLGRVAELVGLHLRVTGLPAAVGDLLEVDAPEPVLVEVAACGAQGLICLPLGV
ncbi:MAG: EscN/YscN/HrcN family type III secretion system ATPase, partial [Nocardioidaceae bacterium]